MLGVTDEMATQAMKAQAKPAAKVAGAVAKLVGDAVACVPVMAKPKLAATPFSMAPLAVVERQEDNETTTTNNDVVMAA